MPTYEYKREDGTVFELIQRINDEPITECPDTGQKVIRLISGGAEPLIKGWSPDKQRRKEDWKKRNPYGTSLPEYQKRIDENTQKALEVEEETRKRATGNLTQI